jgi:prepilin-type N-terminal cleavage/methylation domain-containing protein
MKNKIFRTEAGVSLIELLIALVIMGILVAALYRTVGSQQRIYNIEDQVVDMQQNLRWSITKMVRKIRMAGYGGNILDSFGDVNGFISIITPVRNVNNVGTADDSITVIIADEVSVLTQNAAKGSRSLRVKDANSMFDTGAKKYLCLNGENNYLVKMISGNTVTLADPLAEDHLINEAVSLVKAITYKLQWNNTNSIMPVLIEDENTGAGSQVIAENIEKLHFIYTLSDGTVTDLPTAPENIRMVKVYITGRTKIPDPQMSGDGYRRRDLYDSVFVRNLGLLSDDK